jgi:hypothetical protein
VAIESGQTSNADGLKTALDIVVAPRDALERLRVHATWGWAILIVIVLYTLASYLMVPALLHATQAGWPEVLAQNPTWAAETPAQQQMHLALVLKVSQWAWVGAPIVVFLGSLLLAVMMTIGNMAGRGTASFRRLWAVAVNIGIPMIAIYYVVAAIIALVRGSQSFDSPKALQGVMPSLAILVPETALKLHAFLSIFNPFTLWGVGLTVAAMVIVAGVSRTWAWLTGIVWLLINGALVALLAR